MLMSPTASKLPQAVQGLPRVMSATDRQARKAWERGVVHHKARRFQEAADCFAQATELAPQDTLYWLNLGSALAKLHRPDEALNAAHRAVACDAYNTLAYQLAVKLLRDRGESQEALSTLMKVPADAKLDATHHVLKGACLSDLGKPVEAAQSFLDALTLQPSSTEAHLQLGFNLARMRQHADAAECFRTVLAMSPKALDAALYAVHYAAWGCDWDGVDRDRSALADCMDALTDDTTNAAISPFCLLSITDDAHLMRVMAEWDMRRFHPMPEPLLKGVRPRAAGERLRVGMVSCDFYHHATGMLMVDLLEQLDRERVELFLYSHGPNDGSELRRRIQASADHFVECGGMTTRSQAQRIHEDGIDVLIDLKGFTHDTRISVLSYRPAPVQVAWLGYPGTCGAPFVDYIIGDPVVTPMAHQPFYTEQIAQLPHCYQPNDQTRGRDTQRTRAEVGLPEQAVVFASFNQSYKITREVFEVWCRIVLQTPGSVLWMLTPDEPVRRRLRAEAEARGLSAERLVFADFERIEKHRQRIPLADVHLDTFPCGGHTTCSDALWGGVPTVAWQGESFASRVAPSLLTTLGLPELIVHDLHAYEALAIELGRNPELRQGLKTRLMAARDHAVLYDSGRLGRDLINLLERMWQRAQAGLPPEALPAIC